MRLKDESEAVWDAYPDQYIEIAEFITELGGAEGIILLLSLTYWLSNRRKAATVASYAVAGVACIILIKSLFALPRPVQDEAMAVEAVVPLEDDPHGFPSGHAFMSVVVYGGLVQVFDRTRDPASVLVAGALIVSISMTRIVLRLHYLGDILVGAVLGGAFLAGLAVLVEERPWRGFAIGVTICLPALFVSGFEELALVGFGNGLGGLAVSYWLDFDALPSMRSRRHGVGLAVCGVGYIVVIIVLGGLVAGTDPVGKVAVVLSNVVLLAGILLVPIGVDRLETGGRRLLAGDAEQT